MDEMVKQMISCLISVCPDVRGTFVWVTWTRHQMVPGVIPSSCSTSSLLLTIHSHLSFNVPLGCSMMMIQGRHNSNVLLIGAQQVVI